MGGLGKGLGIGGTVIVLALSLITGRNLFSDLGVEPGVGAGGAPMSAADSAREEPQVQFVSYILDDSQAMAPGVNISSADAVRIEARVSRTGNVIPQSGDLVGTSAVVKPGARGVKIVVDQVVP